MFTNEDLNRAIKDGIFSRNNDVTAAPATIIRFFETWAKERAEAHSGVANILILKNQVVIMESLKFISELPNEKIGQLVEQIIFTKSQIRELS